MLYDFYVSIFMLDVFSLSRRKYYKMYQGSENKCDICECKSREREAPPTEIE